MSALLITSSLCISPWRGWLLLCLTAFVWAAGNTVKCFIYLQNGAFFLALVSSSGNETLARNTLSYSAYLQYAAHLAEVEEAVVFEWIRLKRFCLCNNNIRWGIYSMHCFFLYSRYFASQIFSPPRAMPKALFNPVNLALVAKRLKLFRLVRLVTKLLSCVSFWGKYKTFGDFSKLILNTKKFIFDQPIQQDESTVLSLESLPIFPLNHVSAQIVSDMTK